MTTDEPRSAGSTKPHDARPAPTEAAHAEEVGPARKPIALIVDGHDLFRAGLAVIMRQHLGFATIYEARTLEVVLDHLANLPRLDLAVIDPVGVGANWVHALHRIRARFPRVRFAVVTASTQRVDILATLAAGIPGHVPKGMSVPEIVRALRHVLNGEVFVPPSLAEPIPTPADAVAAPSTSGPAVGTGANYLTPRQRDVLRLLIDGRSNKAIARALGLGEGTVKAHVSALYRALGVHGRVGAIRAVATLNPGTVEPPAKPRGADGWSSSDAQHEALTP